MGGTWTESSSEGGAPEAGKTLASSSELSWTTSASSRTIPRVRADGPRCNRGMRGVGLSSYQ